MPKGPQGQKRPADVIARQNRQVRTLIQPPPHLTFMVSCGLTLLVPHTVADLMIGHGLPDIRSGWRGSDKGTPCSSLRASIALR